MALEPFINDICELTPKDWSELLARAARLGSSDATGGRPARAGDAILAALGVGGHRGGHRRALKAAYSAGRFHVNTMGK